MNDERKLRPAYQLFIAALSVFVLSSLLIELTLPVGDEVSKILQVADFGICLIFLADFLYQLLTRGSTYLRWGWIDLLSSIPTIDVLRWGRLARIIRVFRMIRAFRSGHMLLNYLLTLRAQSTFLAVSMMSIILVVYGSAAILPVERHPDANIRTAEQALWWAIVTITTVGYGDYYPVTGEGHFVAVLLMIGGVGLFGTFAGYVASWFLKDDAPDEIALLRKEVSELRHMLQEKLS